MTVTIAEIDATVAGATAPRRFLELVAAHGDVPALHSMRSDAPGTWNHWTFAQFADHVDAGVMESAPKAA